jgi:hypothetical protein
VTERPGYVKRCDAPGRGIFTARRPWPNRA